MYLDEDAFRQVAPVAQYARQLQVSCLSLSSTCSHTVACTGTNAVSFSQSGCLFRYLC